MSIQALSNIIGKAVRQISGFRSSGRPLPAWLQKQEDAIYQMETDPLRGISIFKEGLQDEADHLEGLENG